MEKKGDVKLIKALKKDYKELYVKEYTTGWKEQRFIRNIELEVMSLKNTKEYISHELDKAREEGREEGINAVLYPRFKREKNGTLKREGWVDTSKLNKKK